MLQLFAKVAQRLRNRSGTRPLARGQRSGVRPSLEQLESRLVLDGSDRRAAMAISFVTSPEYLGNLISNTFVSLLHRGPNQMEIGVWRDTIRGNNLRDEQFIGRVLSSAEYANLHGGADNAAWVAAVFQDELGRPARPEEIPFWRDMLPTHSRQDVGTQIAMSPAAEAGMINTYYQNYLYHLADSSTLSRIANDLHNGLITREQEQVWILSNDEYFDRHGRRNEPFVDAMYRDVLHRTETREEADYWLHRL